MDQYKIFESTLDPWLKEGPPEEGDLAVWRIVNPPAKARFFAVPTPAVGAFFIQALSIADLGNGDIFSNIMSLNVYEDGEWIDWYDEDGDDIEKYINVVGEYQRVQNNRRESVVVSEMTAEEREKLDQSFLPKGKIVKADSDQ